MTVAVKFLISVLVVELLVSAWFVSAHVQRIAPPEIDLSRLDDLTAAALSELQAKALTGTARSWRELAEASLGNGYYLAAEQCFHHASKLDSSDLQAVYGRGFCLERMGRTESAIEVLNDVVSRDDGELARTCWYQIGRCWLRQENGEEAEAAFRKIQEFPPAAYQLARILVRTGRAAEAMPILDKQMAALPNSLKLIQLRRHAAEALGDTVEARNLQDQEDRSEYQLVLEYGQSFISMFSSRYGLARVLSTAMKMKTGGTLQDRQTALNPALRVIRSNRLWQYRSVLLAAAHVELGLGNLAKANELLEEIETNTQTGVDVLELRAMILEAEGENELAYKILLRIADQKPSADVYRLLATADVDVADSVRKRHQALSTFRSGVDAFRVNDIERALKAFSEAVVVLPMHEWCQFYLGECYRLSGEIDMARKSFEACLELNPDNGRCLNSLQLVSEMEESVEQSETDP